MSDPRWMSPPEVVAAIFEAGPGPTSVIANQLVWITETVHHELAAGLSSVNTAATSARWVSLGGAASAGTATFLNTELQTLAGWITHKVAVTQAATDAYTVAVSTVIPSVVCQSNRDECAALHASNVFGQNTPAIIALDTQYFGEHYPHNSSVGWAYSGALSALTAALAVPPPLTPMGVTPGAPVAAGEAVAETAATSVASRSGQAAELVGAGPAANPAADMSAVFNQVPQLLSQGMKPLTEVFRVPAQGIESASSPVQSLFGSFGSMGGMFPATSSTVNAATADAIAEPLRAGGGVAGGIGAGAGGVGAYPGAGLTTFTRPTSSFAPENAGRPVGLRAGLLNAAELRGPITNGPVGGAAMPVSAMGAGMLHRGHGDSGTDEVAHARIVVGERQDRHLR